MGSRLSDEEVLDEAHVGQVLHAALDRAFVYVYDVDDVLEEHIELDERRVYAFEVDESREEFVEELDD